jgi:transcriptional regulator with GAF, ATPase, and Fis domain
VLQEGQIERLGSARTVNVDVRVIAATNKDLVDGVRNGTFRQDLFYRLNVFPITLPGLRDRREDLPALLRHFCDRLGRQIGKPVDRISPGTLEALQQYDWPGNIREFENVIQQAVILSRDGVLDLANFSSVSVRPVVPSYPDQLEKLVDVQRAHILRVLESTNWRIEGTTGAAKILGLCASTLRTRMRKLGIRRPVQSPASGVSHFPAAVSEPGRFSGFRAAAS